MNFNRRDFLKTTSITAIGTLVSVGSFASIIKEQGKISLVITPDDSIANGIPSNWAVAELKKALESRGSKVDLVDKPELANGFCVLVAGTNSVLAKNIINKQKVEIPAKPESLCILQAELDKKPILLVAGTDERGLVYALTELADRVNCIQTNEAALEFNKAVIEQPASKVRSVLRGFSSELEDKPWFYDKEYWMEYLDLLAYSRINRLNFSTGMAYNSVRGVTDGYMVFPYPFFVQVPGFDVTVSGLSDEERKKNLEILKFVGKEAAKRAIQFHFGIWTLAYDWDQGDKKFHSPNATYKTHGLNENTHPEYCKNALSILLQEVPEISGITFRVHEESGVSLGTSNFWETQFSAIANCGRKVEIDMHAKNMEEETLYAALATKQPVVVSPKFCGEHLGLPYHQASIRDYEMLQVDKLLDKGEGLLEGNRKFTRYGYADMLSENRTWDVVYRIWPGTQRFLLSADPELFSGYGKTAAFCGAAGFELCEPLHFKGRRNTGVEGGRCGYADVSLNPRFDFEKYNYFYRVWGRLAFNPDTNPGIWRRALNKDFGKAALDIENALAQVTRVLPLFYMAHAVSANCEIYLPEIYQNSFMTGDRNWPYDTQAPKTFGTISPIDPQLFQSPNECAEALIQDINTGKYSPIEVAGWLENIAASASASISNAEKTLANNSEKPSFRRIEEDVLILIGLARFFAAKLRSGVLWQIYMLSGNLDTGNKAVELYADGRNVWAKMAERAKTIYKLKLSFGPQGHWIDRIPSFDEDISDMKNLLKTPIKPTTVVKEDLVKKAISITLAEVRRPKVEGFHENKDNYEAGKPHPIEIKITNKCKRVELYYRQVNQSKRWQTNELEFDGGSFKGEIPANYTSSRFPLQYYFKIEMDSNEKVLFPAFNESLSNVPYYVLRKTNKV
jgi:hypothetical protein